MKNLLQFIQEKLTLNKNISSDTSTGWYLLNGFGIETNKKYQKLAKMSGYKVKGKYYFASVRNSSKEECEKHKAQDHIKDDPNFIIVHKSEFDSDSPNKD